ncbi:hypothetical protein [Corynebacterium casei]|uniref:hypothetical protein n=1 Tax=Corynebacterium casei TaxID=160386 RepID=UPI003FD40865
MKVKAVVLTTVSALLLGVPQPAVASAAPSQNAVGSLLSNEQGNEYRLITEEERLAANQLAQENGESGLPQSFESVIFLDNGSMAPGDAEGNPLLLARAGAGATAWKVTKCIAHITLVVLPGTAAFRAIRGLGGIAYTARLLVGAGTKKEFRKIAGGAAAEILGISGIEENCFRGW